jgi:NAD(P)-dependent dehydrogenase (short-subunit alcohol dehydrogenase family)
MKIEGLQGRTAIVTAAGQNVGKAVALAFAKAGANVVINGLAHLDKIEQVAREAEAFGVRALPILADCADWPSVEKMVAQAIAAFGAIDIAVAAVGIRPRQAFHEISVEDWDRVVGTNLNSAFYLDRAVLPGMRQRKFGRIIHMAGSDAQFPLANRAHVVASKHALHGLAKAIALEYGPEGITANSVAPGWVDTDRKLEWFPDLQDTLSHLRQTLPLRHIGDVDDIANACLYLASDMGKFMTGQMIHINGGEFMA